MQQIFFWLILSACTLAQCKTRSQSVLEEFKKVNKELEEANSKVIANNARKLAYMQIVLYKDKQPQLVQKADSLYNTADSVFLFIENVKTRLKETDTTGERLDAGSEVLINTNAGMTLVEQMREVYRYAKAGAVSKSVSTGIDSLFYYLPPVGKEQYFLKDFFDLTPTFGTLTILSKFQNDCIHSSTIVLDDILQQLMKKTN